MRSYEDVVSALERALVFGIEPSLAGIRELTTGLQRPQDAFASIQITGTNGKTSTARFAEALLRAHGVRTGLYTSPHLQRYPERIEVGGRGVSDEDFARAMDAVLDCADRLRPSALGRETGYTEFELLTAAALWSFREHGVGTAVLEVGMGGRWDATSVVDPAVAVITGIGLDHTAVLGPTTERIAVEKAGIIKPGAVVVLGPGTAGLDSIFIERAHTVGASVRAVREQGASSPVPESDTVRFAVRRTRHSPGGATVLDVCGPGSCYEGLELIAPSYQAANVATATTAAEAAHSSVLAADRVSRALATVTLPGRFEVVGADPVVVVDGSHNPQAAAVLAGAIAEAWPDERRRPVVLLGVLADKDAEGIVAALASVTSEFAVCTPASSRALAAERLAAVVARVTGRWPLVFSGVEEALAELLDRAPEGLVVTGSLVTAGQARPKIV